MTSLNDKLTTAANAVQRIDNGQTIATSGFVGAAVPEALLVALEARFVRDDRPRELTLLYGAGQGDGATRGLNHLAHEGLVRRVIGGHWGLAPKMGQLATAGKIAGYNFPQGVMCQLFRDIAAGRPGCITHVGLDTFIDPAHDGGRLSAACDENLVERVTLGGEDFLWYKSLPIHVGLLRATAADPLGNLSMCEEAISGEVLPIAQAARNSSGIVIAQVKLLLDEPLPPHHVDVPGVLIDNIVVASEREHPQTFGETTSAFYSTPKSTDDSRVANTMPNDARRIIASRACDELPRGAICNLGIGMPEGIARIAAERGILNDVTLTVESGPIGGVPAGGLSFGASVHPQAIIDQPAMFDFYDGGGLDFAALGAAEIDQRGNVNVSRFGTRLAGVGGFVNITQNAKRVVFCGTFTAGGLRAEVCSGKLNILQEGVEHKFVERVKHVSFSATRAIQKGQEVLYVTERAVFRLTKTGLELIEVAPSIDLGDDVLQQMAFEPIVGVPRAMSLA